MTLNEERAAETDTTPYRCDDKTSTEYIEKSRSKWTDDTDQEIRISSSTLFDSSSYRANGVSPALFQVLGRSLPFLRGPVTRAHP